MRRYANRRVPREAHPRLHVTHTRGRRPSSNDAERKHSGDGQRNCDSSDDGQRIDPNARKSVREILVHFLRSE